MKQIIAWSHLYNTCDAIVDARTTEPGFRVEIYWPNELDLLSTIHFIDKLSSINRLRLGNQSHRPVGCAMDPKRCTPVLKMMKAESRNWEEFENIGKCKAKHDGGFVYTGEYVSFVVAVLVWSDDMAMTITQIT
jgi:hypothetical protein